MREVTAKGEVSPGMVKVFQGFLLAVAIYLFVYHSFFEVWNYSGLDFPLFYEASQAVWQGHSPYESIFRNSTQAGQPIQAWGHYIYPTFYACHLIPFLIFSCFWAKKVYVLISMAAYSVTFLFYRRLTRLFEQSTWTNLAILYIWLLWTPVVDNFRHGQSNGLMFLLLFGAWLSARNDRRNLTGVFIGLSCAVKLTPLIILPLFLAAMRPRTALSAFGTFAATCALFFPSYNWIYFTRVLPLLRNSSKEEFQLAFHSVLLSIADKLGWDMGWLALAVSVVIYGTFLVVIFKRRERIRSESLLLLGMLLTPILAGERGHHAMLAVLPIAWIFQRGIERWGSVREQHWKIAGLLMLVLPGIFYFLPLGKAVMSVVTTVFPLEPANMLSPALLILAVSALWQGFFEERSTGDLSEGGVLETSLEEAGQQG